MIEGIWSIPVNLPFTRFNRSLKASVKTHQMLKELLIEKRLELKRGAAKDQDLISCLLSIVRDEDGEELMSEKEIIDNAVITMAAGHDTSSVLITFLIRLLATDQQVYEAVLKGIISHKKTAFFFFILLLVSYVP